MMDKTENIKETELIDETSEQTAVSESETPEAVAETTAAEVGADNSVEAVADVDAPKGKKKRRIKLHEITAENDIKYRGPLSYRHLRIFAWVFLALAQIGYFLSVASRVDPSWGAGNQWLIDALGFLGSLTLPLFLLAAFATILNAKDGYKKMIMSYCICFFGIILAFIFIYNHYAVGLASTLSNDTAEAKDVINTLLFYLSGNGFLAINIFVDLLLCTLFTFFINYHPVKYFQGKKIIIFRLFALLPIIYEVVSITLKILSTLGQITLSVYIFPFLTTKPPAMFLMFLALAFFIKIREHKYRKHGKTLKEYKAFLKTNANSLHFSVYTCIIIVITVIIDLIAMIFVTAIIYTSTVGAEVAESGEAISEILNALVAATKLGFGESAALIFVIPFVLLFSYTKTYKDSLVDKLVPVGGIGLVGVVFIEGIFQILCVLLSQL